MIKKLRTKFIIINMVIVTVMLSVLLGFIIVSTRQNLESDSISMMRNIAREPRHQGAIREPENENMRLPFMVVSYDRDGVLTAKGGYYDLSDTQTIELLYNTALKMTGDVGEIEQYDLRFVKTKSPSGDVVVFSDIKSEKIVLKGIIRDCLLIGAVAWAGFFAVSFLLARWAVKPVENAWEQQKQFVADASHDLKTPLTVILTDAELLQTEECTEENRLILATAISKMAVQMKGLVTSLLDLASAEKEKSSMVLSDVDFSEIVKTGCLTFEPAFYENNLTLKYEVEDGIHVKGNENELSDLVGILLDNAQKYCSSNTETNVILKKQGKGCLLKVSDYGDMISKQDQINIFKRFYRTDKSRSMDQSYGLGLSIASQIVSNHSGKIWCDSDDGLNTFYVRLYK